MPKTNETTKGMKQSKGGQPETNHSYSGNSNQKNSTMPESGSAKKSYKEPSNSRGRKSNNNNG